MSTKFIIAYEVEGATYTCKVDASNWDEAERHLIALALTGRVSGEHVMDVPEVDDTALLRQALEALKKSHPYSNSDRDLDKHSEAIHALRAALAEQPAEPVAWRWLYNGSPDSEKCFPMPGPDADVIAKAGASEFPRTVQYLYTAPQPKREPVEATPYNLKRIAWELERTALGDGFYGNALRVTKDMPGITPEDRSVLDRYATGTQTDTDHVHLQWLAQRLRF